MPYEPLVKLEGSYNQEELTEEFSRIRNALLELLSRIETDEHNAMETHLDMNEHRVLNLPKPINPTDVVRLIDLLEGPIFDKIILALKDAGY